MSPPVMDVGAKGPSNRERETQKTKDLNGSDWRKRREMRRRIEETAMVVKRNGLPGFSQVCGWASEEAVGRDWKRNLGLLSSSKNSIFSQRSPPRSHGAASDFVYTVFRRKILIKFC